MHITDSVIDRFSKFFTPTSANACWIWIGSYSGNYGQFNIEGRSVKAHRVAYMIDRCKDIPEGKHICHKCDNPRCVNPKHLFLGDAALNGLDRSIKYRISRGIPLVKVPVWRQRLINERDEVARKMGLV